MALNKRSKIKLVSFAALSLAIMSGLPATAQMHAPFLSDQQWLNLSEQQYIHQLYPSAVLSAVRYNGGPAAALYLNGDPVSERDKITFLRKVSDLKIKTRDAADSAKAYISQTANPVYRQRTAFDLARYYFYAGNWQEAIAYYELAGIANLSNAEIADAKFEQAYCYFNNLQFEQADPLFATIKEVPGRYNSAGNYYYGLLAYNKSDYENALRSFERIQDLEQYRDIVPYYIAELYYFKGDRAKALQLSRQLIARPEKLYYHNELYLLIGQCLFEEQQYKEALPFFEHYYNHADQVRKEDVYKMGYCYYQTSNWDQAVTSFKELSNAQDSLGQTAMYLLGDCYLKTNDKKGAKNAFSICSEMPYNQGQQEASLLLAGKLAFEAGYSTEGTEKIRKLMNSFPESPYINEAKSLLSEQLLKSDNYGEAYRLLSEIPVKEEQSRSLFQRAAYGKALQELQLDHLDNANSLLNESLEHAVSTPYEAAAYFWKSEIAYRNRNYAAVLTDGRSFLDKNSAAVTQISAAATSQHALMNMGYASMKLEDYNHAREFFAQSQQASAWGFSAKSAADAALREADAAFMQKDFDRAVTLYNKTISSGNADADYARYQKSILLGLQGKDAEQGALLKTIVAQVPASKYLYESRYALGEWYLDADKYDAAIDEFHQITNANAPHLAVKALMKTGFAYQEADKDEQAIAVYRRVITEYPSSDQRTGALEALRDLYVNTNQPGAYVQLLKDNNIAAPDNNGLDSVFYAAAETRFAAGKYDEAATAMGNYLQQYPNGLFTTKAHFYKAESHAQRKEVAAALKEYSAVLGTAWNDFTEPAAKKAAVLAYGNNDYAAAEQYYGILRSNAVGSEALRIAYRGMMLSAARQDKKELSTAYADTLLNLPDLEENARYEALLLRGNAALSAGDFAAANSLFDQVSASKDIEVSSEAIYQKAALLLQQGKLTEAEAAATKAIQQTTASEYWNARSYLLIADVFIRQKDYFNAKATLQSIVKNIRNESLKQEANRKLAEVKQLEKGKSKLSEG